MKKAVLFFLLSISILSSIAQKSDYGFIENKGQFFDLGNRTPSDVLFKLNGNKFSIQLKNSGFNYTLYTIKTVKKSNVWGIYGDSIDYSYELHNIEVVFLGANKNVFIETRDANKDYINYYTQGTGEAGITNVKHYKQVYYHNLYPNIDLQFLSNGGNPKYNFVLRKGAKVSDIKIKYINANRAEVNAAGDLEIESSIGRITETIPESFFVQGHELIDINYVQLESNIFGFKGIDVVDREVIIDPSPIKDWGTYFGGNNTDNLYSMCNDKQGNVIVTGKTLSTQYLAYNGFQDTMGGGNTDGFLAKFDSSGNRLWSTYIGGNLSDYCNEVDADSSGNIYCTGITNSHTNIATAGSFQDTIGGQNDAFLIKVNANGIRLWGTYCGGILSDEGTGIEVYQDSIIYWAGTTQGSSNIPLSGFKSSVSGVDAFLMKFDSSGNQRWGTYYGGGNVEFCRSVKADKSGNVYMCGITQSSTGIASGGHQNTHGSYSFSNPIYDAFLVKFSAGGSRLWGTYYGGNDEDRAFDLDVDDSSNVFLTGYTSSTNNISYQGHQNSLAGSTDAFLVKFNSSGVRQWGTYYGGMQQEDGRGISIKHNDIYIAGRTFSNTNIAFAAAQRKLSGNTDAFLARFNTNGKIVWGTYVGGSGNEFGFDCSTFGNSLYIGGTTESTDSIAKNAFSDTLFGTYDGYILKFGNSKSFYSSAAVTHACTYDSLKIYYASELYNFNSGNTFTVLLSDSLGNFNAPTTLKVLNSTNTFDNINVLIPNTINQGFNYRVRVISSNPIDTSTISDSIAITPKPIKPHITILGNSTFCNQDSVVLVSTYNSFYNHVWHRNKPAMNNTDTFLIVRDVSNYSYWVTDSFGCISDRSDTVTTVVNPKPVAAFSVDKDTSCFRNNQFKFKNNSSINGGSISGYFWDFGNSDTSLIATPTYSYSSDGKFSVSLLVISDKGCKDTAQDSLKVFPQPVAAFSVNDKNQCLKENEYTFTNNSSISNGTISYVWLFGNGDTAFVKDTVLSYSDSGKYKVQLIVSSDKLCRDTFNSAMIVLSSPQAIFYFNKKNQCIEVNNYQFANRTVFPDSSRHPAYLWYFGDSDSSVAVNPQKTYSDSGSYKVTLIAYSDSLCTDTFSDNGVVYPRPLANISLSNNKSCLAGNNFVFKDLSVVSTGPTSSYWNFGNGITTNTRDTAITYASSGNYTVKLISSSGLGCKDTTSQSITILPMPVANFEIVSKDSCLKNNEFTFINKSTSASPISYINWDLGDSSYSVLDTVFKTYDSIGAYTIKLVVNSTDNCIDSVVKIANIYSTPVADFTINDSSQCLYDNLFVFTNSSSVLYDSIAHYRWYIGNQDSSSAIDVAKVFMVADSVEIKLIVSTSNSCYDTLTKQIIIHDSPVANFELSDSAMCLSQNSFQTTNMSTISSGQLTFKWHADGDSNINLSPTFSFLSPGFKQISLSAISNNNCTDTMSKFVLVLPSPIKPIINGPTNSRGKVIDTFSVNYDSGAMYMWHIDDGTILSGQTSDTVLIKWPEVTSNLSASISVVETNVFGCLSDTGFYIVNLAPSKVNSLNRQLLINVYPNPSTGYLYVEIPAYDRPYTLKVIDNLGRTAIEKYSNNKNTKLDITVADGVYWLVIEGDGLYFTKKIVVSKQ
jgi:PKD repeat protein